MDQQTGFICGFSYDRMLLNIEFLLLTIENIIIVLFTFGYILCPFADANFWGM